MRNPLNNKAKMISADAAQALQKIVANADLKWLFYIMIEGNYVSIGVFRWAQAVKRKTEAYWEASSGLSSDPRRNERI